VGTFLRHSVDNPSLYMPVGSSHYAL